MAFFARQPLGKVQKPENKAADLVRQLDARLRHINQTILPSAPYLLQVPSNYRLGEQQANDWRRGSPFKQHEERLQYMTFLQHRNDDTMFHTVGGWDDGKGNFKPAPDRRSGTSSPLPGQPAKKKISLLDYKKKASGQSAADPPQLKAEREAKLSPKAEGSVSSTDAQRSEKSEGQQILSHGVKRGISEMRSPSEKKSEAPPQGSPPLKKARPSAAETSSTLERHNEEKPGIFTLPPILSPIRSNTEKPPTFNLPELLSPTLPPIIEEQLRLQGEKKVTGRKQSFSGGANKTENKPSPKGTGQTDNSKPTRSPTRVASTSSQTAEKEQPKPLSSSKIREEQLAATNGVADIKSIHNGASYGTKNEEPTVSAPKPQPSQWESQHLVVKLKIPKPIRKICARILGMTPRPQKQIDQRPPKYKGTEDAIRELSATSKGASRVEHDRDKRSPLPNRKPQQLGDQVAAPPGSAEKRRRQDEDGIISEPSSKRHKHVESLDVANKPHTPVRPPVSPLQPQHGSALKSHLSTPKQDLKNTTMRRVGSSEGDVKTPLGAARGSTPAAIGAPERANREGRPSSASSSHPDVPSNDRIVLLKAEQTKYSSLGRNLKHAVHRILPSESDFKVDSSSTKEGAALAVEALISFVLSFVLSDEIRRSYVTSPDASIWRTMLGFVAFVKRVTQLYSPLNGLVHQVEGVCRDTISLYDARRLERDAVLNNILEDSRPSTGNSNPALSPSAIEKAKTKSEFARFHREHTENLRIVQDTWQIGYTRLSLRDLQRLFPDTWANAADVPSVGKGKDDIVAGNYMDGSYYLPLGPASTGMDAVRAGWRMLAEWCRKEGVKWEGKLGL